MNRNDGEIGCNDGIHVLAARSSCGVGATLPDFTASSTHGTLNFRGWSNRSWVYLFNIQPAIGTICKDELIDVELEMSRFRPLGIRPLGIAPTELSSVSEWSKIIGDEIGAALSFPIVADPYGSLLKKTRLSSEVGQHHDGKRSSILLDPKGKIRACFQYPLEIKRNLEEPMRVSALFQAAEVMDRFSFGGWPFREKTEEIPHAPTDAPRTRSSASVISLAEYRAERR